MALLPPSLPPAPAPTPPEKVQKAPAPTPPVKVEEAPAPSPSVTAEETEPERAAPEVQSKPSVAPLPPVPQEAQESSNSSDDSPDVAKVAPPVAGGGYLAQKPPEAPSQGYPPRETPARPGPQINPGLPQARRQRAELVSQLQYLCRLFLETREQLYAAHEGTQTEANCDGLREELDAVRFRRLLEETLGKSHGARPKPLIRLLRSFGRRALYGRRRSPYGRQAYALFRQACTGHEGPQGFVLRAVPQILRLIDRLIDEGRRAMGEAMEDGGDDPWLDGADDETDVKAKGGLPDWDRLEGILSEPQNLESLHAEADAFLAAETSKPTPLCLSKAEREASAAPDSGSFAPRGRGRAAPGPTGDGQEPAKQSLGRRILAQGPYYSCDPSLLLKVAKAPLPNLDSLVNTLVPGAEITTEGLLQQLADEDLVVMAYAFEQIAEAASKRLVKDLEVRDELRSTCMHRREYLQLLEGALRR